jgi:hypothetical protein
MGMGFRQRNVCQGNEEHKNFFTTIPLPLISGFNHMIARQDRVQN